ncbi:MAG TPA: orotate phosphoribosyltransferase [Gemmatimonadales bacterium]|nr:orotate phosphoribosyltransferase [Gemmatimonadales bacterium]
MNRTEQLERLLLERSVQRGDFTLASGLKSSYYIDCRPTTMSAEGLSLIGTLGLEAIRTEGWRADAVGGLTMGADPVAYAIAGASWSDPPPIDAFSVRKESKEHGTRRLVEGNFRKGHRVVVVEDVITTGGSALQAIGALREAGAEIVGVLAVVDREQGGKEKIEDVVPRVVVLTTVTRLGLKPRI